MSNSLRKDSPREEMVVVENGELRIFPVHLKDRQPQEGSYNNGAVS